MDGRGGYAGGDGEEDWGGVGRESNKKIFVETRNDFA